MMEGGHGNKTTKASVLNFISIDLAWYAPRRARLREVCRRQVRQGKLHKQVVSSRLPMAQKENQYTGYFQWIVGDPKQGGSSVPKFFFAIITVGTDMNL